jgi:3-deoxy-D-manno-octulosonate 8-phosphate phosphatase (KDO 8-P phosphatase)
MFLEKLNHIKAIILDVDGVLTNGILLLTESGEQLRQFNIKDGYALQLAVKKGIKVAILSGARSKGVEHRLRGLGIQDIFLGLNSKLEVYSNYLIQNNLKPDQVLFMGDDIPDYEVLKAVGFSTCPNDAATEVKSICHYVSPIKGGKGAVRDVIEKTLKAQGLWLDSEGFVW